VVCPGSVQDAYDLMRLAVADPNPVLYFEHKALYRSLKGELHRRRPDGRLEAARVVREGQDVTLVSYAATLGRSVDAAERLAEEGVSVEVLDLRCISPMDFDTIAGSVQRTARAVVAHEDTRTLGIGAEIAARLAETCFYDLDAPVARVTAPDTPIPAARSLEEAFLPSVERIAAALRECVAA
jgi:pyruvate/2-oxoglutarate/acetoin dehydrogenase E1 component